MGKAEKQPGDHPGHNPVPRPLTNLWALIGGLALFSPGLGLAQTERVFQDPRGDVRLRRTDRGDNGVYDPLIHSPADLLSVRLGAWLPANPARNLFEGQFSAAGGFVRLDLILDGLMNPPGNVAKYHDPYAFGPHPVIGFVEIDMDADVQTGGELLTPMMRYLGVAARFGGKAGPTTFRNRIARWFDDFLLDFNTPPYTRRHGEEFHLDFVGEYLRDGFITIVVGDNDSEFECGETWWVEAPLWHRAHGFEEFSFAERCGRPGQYIPRNTVLQFAHDDNRDITMISLVYPLTNNADAERRNEPPQRNDGNACNQASILEALVDLVFSARWYSEHPSGRPEEDIILAWRDKNPQRYLDPDLWTLTVTLGVPYMREDPESLLVVYTDIFPNPVQGDVNGDGVADNADRAEIAEFLRTNGQEGAFVIRQFSLDFNLYDTNYDGTVDAFDRDRRPRPGDSDDDDDIDLADARVFWSCFGRNGSLPPACRQMDFDLDDRVTLRDYRLFARAMLGPGRR